MNKLTKDIFKELGVEPNVEFRIRGVLNQTFMFSDDLVLLYRINTEGSFSIAAESLLRKLITRERTIIKKPLITEREKLYLNFRNFESLVKKEDCLQFNIGNKKIYVRFDNLNLTHNFNFEGLQINKYYTREELDL